MNEGKTRALEALTPYVLSKVHLALRSGRVSDIHVDVKGALLSARAKWILFAMVDVAKRTISDKHSISFCGVGYDGALLCAGLSAHGASTCLIANGKIVNSKFPLKRPQGLVLATTVLTTNAELAALIGAVRPTLNPVAVISVVDRRDVVERGHDVLASDLYTEVLIRSVFVEEDLH
jgi:hypothetical protein